jgi:hypothetical protein
MATEKGSTWIVNNNRDGDLTRGWTSLPPTAAAGGSLACPSVRYLPSDGYYYTISGGHTVLLQRSRDLLVWESSKKAAPFLQASPADVLTATTVMSSAADNLRSSQASLSFPNRSKWDHDSNDADVCCESWGGASPDHGGPTGSYVVWGADGQGGSGWKTGCVSRALCRYHSCDAGHSLTGSPTHSLAHSLARSPARSCPRAQTRGLRGHRNSKCNARSAAAVLLLMRHQARGWHHRHGAAAREPTPARATIGESNLREQFHSFTGLSVAARGAG